jgi:hypothetical protein
MPCVRLAFVLKRRDAMVLLALRFCLSYFGGLSFQLIPLMHSHDKMARSSSFNGSSSNRGGQKYFVYNQLQYLEIWLALHRSIILLLIPT